MEKFICGIYQLALSESRGSSETKLRRSTGLVLEGKGRRDFLDNKKKTDITYLVLKKEGTAGSRESPNWWVLWLWLLEVV
jgi:hypothetical protein